MKHMQTSTNIVATIAICTTLSFLLKLTHRLSTRIASRLIAYSIHDSKTIRKSEQSILQKLFVQFSCHFALNERKKIEKTYFIERKCFRKPPLTFFLLHRASNFYFFGELFLVEHTYR